MASDGDKAVSLLRAIRSAFQALAGHPEAILDFGTIPQGLASTDDRLCLHLRDAAFSLEDMRVLRGAADAAALRIRYHDARRFAAQCPADASRAELFSVGEQIRVEALGLRRWGGVAGNLDALHDAVSRQRSHHLASARDAAQSGDAFVLWLREALTGRPVTAAGRPLLDAWRREFDDQLFRKAAALRAVLGDQFAFGEALRDMIDCLHLDETQAQIARTGPEDEAPESSPEDHAEDSDETQGDAKDSALDLDAREGETDADADEPASDPLEIPAETDAKGRGGGLHLVLREQAPIPGYHAYTAEYDEVVDASTLCEAEELTRLRARLDAQVAQTRGLIARLANRLQRRLLAQQLRWWDFDREEGVLDSARLARIVVDSRHALSFKVEKYSSFRDTVVTLLIDNSGSMRGRPIAAAAACADIIASTLDRCGVKVEILGFTTRAWSGGQSREKWVADGQPQHPGRLNDLRHIVYKAADTPWRRARRQLGLMLSDGLLKGNVDGEALLWACQRLGTRPEARRIMLVISDGAPVDDATLTVNAGNYLDLHLREAIRHIETRTSIELTAIGIAHDVGRYYRRAVTIYDLDELGAVLLRDLIDLFDGEREIRRRKMQSFATA